MNLRASHSFTLCALSWSRVAASFAFGLLLVLLSADLFSTAFLRRWPNGSSQVHHANGVNRLETSAAESCTHGAVGPDND